VMGKIMFRSFLNPVKLDTGCIEGSIASQSTV